MGGTLGRANGMDASIAFLQSDALEPAEGGASNHAPASPHAPAVDAVAVRMGTFSEAGGMNITMKASLVSSSCA